MKMYWKALGENWRRHPRACRVMGFCVLLGCLAVLFGPSYVTHMRVSAVSFVFNDDARQQIVPFFRYSDPAVFEDDYVVDYYLACMPIGYRALYTTAATVWDPAAFSKVLPYILLAIVIVATTLCAVRLSGVGAGWGVAAILLSSSFLLYRLGGGLPRSFFFPFVACSALFLVYGRVWLLAAAAGLAAAFYPVAAAVPGLSLAAVLFVIPKEDRGDAARWSFRKRLAVVASTAVLGAILVAPTALNTRRFGPMLTSEDAVEFTELGPGGRYGDKDRPPFPSLSEALLEAMPLAFEGNPSRWNRDLFVWTRNGPRSQDGLALRLRIVLVAIWSIAAFGLIRLAWLRPDARRLAAMIVAMCVGYQLAVVFAPYLFLPQRYIGYPAPILVCVFFACGAAEIPGSFGAWGRRPLVKGAGAIFATLLCIAFMSGRIGPAEGLTVAVTQHKDIYDKIATLPPDSLIAGWPEARGANDIIDNVPYLCRRRAFVTLETHQAFHRGYVEEMRGRMRALIEAYFAASPEPLLRLRDEFGVTHLEVNLKHYGGSELCYFEPFSSWAVEARVALAGKKPETIRQYPKAGVVLEDTRFLLDLSRIEPATPSTPESPPSPPKQDPPNVR